MSEEIVDFSEAVEPDDMPMCPLCENSITEDEPACLIFAHGCKGIAHSLCVMSARDDLDI